MMYKGRMVGGRGGYETRRKYLERSNVLNFMYYLAGKLGGSEK